MFIAIRILLCSFQFYIVAIQPDLSAGAVGVGLCLTNLNQLGGTLTLAPYNDGRRNQCLTDDLSSVNCDFNEVCAYGSSYENQWMMTSGYGDQNQWTSSVGTGITATPKSVAVQLNSNAPKATLISDPIPCTGAGRSQIYYSYWLTSNINLFVCFVGQTSGHQVCTDQLGQQSTGYPGPTSFAFTQPFDEPFTYGNETLWCHPFDAIASPPTILESAVSVPTIFQKKKCDMM
uniref:Uncharacterized protein n=1 Tax=Romanomermis culicivorax TaxID=13658 RepID=A0A915LCW8_ROMCU